MARNYRPVDRSQEFLLPPNMAEWLPEDHLVWFLIDLVDELDTSGFHVRCRLGGAGRRGYDPDMLLVLLLYAYAVGEKSSRRIERLCVDHVAFRVLCAQDVPDHTSIARFRAEHEDAFIGLFAQILQLCAQSGMLRVGSIAIDGTKIAANASRGANRSPDSVRREAAERAAEIAESVVTEAAATDAAEDAAEDAAGTETRGGTDGLPPQFASRKSRATHLAKAVAELDKRQTVHDEDDAQDVAQVEAYLQRLERGEFGRGGARGRSCADPVRELQARIVGWEKRISDLEGLTGYDAAKKRSHSKHQLKTNRRKLADLQTKIDHGYVPDLRGPSQRQRDRRASKAIARGAKGESVNVTDPDSRLMTSGASGGSVQGYNVQFAVTDDHCVLAVHVSQDASDVHCYKPTLEHITAQTTALGKKVDVILMDAGYFTDENLTHDGPEVLIAPGKNRDLVTQQRQSPTTGEPPGGLTPKEAMSYQLRNPENAERYKRRGATVETVFAHLKEQLNFQQFSRRGLPAVTSEINIAATALNIRRLHSLTTAR